MKKKMGRPILADVPKSILVGARVAPKEEERIERDAAKAGLSKSEWVRQRLLGPENQTPRADLRKLWSRTRILLPDGQEISKGLIKLRAAPVQGWFVPDHQESPLPDIPPNSKLVAEIGIHRFDLSEWHYCDAEIEVTSEGLCNLGPHYHFSCPLQ